MIRKLHFALLLATFCAASPFTASAQQNVSVAAAYSGDVRFEYGSSTRNGFNSARRFVIPSASIIKDGQFHTYRLDLGLEVFNSAKMQAGVSVLEGLLGGLFDRKAAW
ncbi:MAG: hypothetical protein WED15_05250 [Akkermansiaceae bacterium]